MAYETPITIKKVIDQIKRQNFVLPAIQREFVWEPYQIERLFDSLMRDYPICTFLFWKVEKENIEKFQFYRFLRNYHETKSKHNTKIDLDEKKDLIAILDGQQRMTSLYIALDGSYASKIPYKRWDDEDAFPLKQLYLNIAYPARDIEMEYEFKMMTKEAVAASQDLNVWFCMSDMLQMTEPGQVFRYLMDKGLTDTSKYKKEVGDFALSTLNKLFNLIHNDGVISYFLESDEELDKVLQIFIRINSGGTKLSYSDLLLSIATAQWKDKHAREVIHEFVDDINRIGDGFNFNKDFVLKASLVLGDIADIKFNVDNFTKKNMKIIEANWDRASRSIKKAIKLVSNIGYNRDNLMANNAIIPIAYYIQVNEFENSILHKSERAEDRKNIKEWLARVFLKGTFGGTPDAIYPVMRTLFKENMGRFPLDRIIEHYKGKRRSIIFSMEDINSILQLQYGKAKTFNALCLLYPSLNYSFKYHQDHIHPKSHFKMRNSPLSDIDDSEMKRAYRDRYNTLPNLQLLQATENEEKNNSPFIDWLNARYHDENSRRNYLLLNHIDPNVSLEFDEFLTFYNSRAKIMKEQLIKILNVNTESTEA